jgi:hypothetical protein
MKPVPKLFRFNRVVGPLVAVMLALWASALQAQDYHYRYVSFDTCEAPPGYTGFGGTIQNSGRLYGSVSDEQTFLPYIAVCAQGVVTVLQPEVPAFLSAVNTAGTVLLASVLVDPVNFITQAALFRNGQVELIPPLPGEFTSFGLSLTDTGMALVSSFNEFFEETVLLYQKGETTPLDFGLTNYSVRGMNNQGIIAGTTGVDGVGDRGFRFDSRTGRTTLLDPLPTEQHAWAVGINNHGDILGYSFVAGGIERIGVWSRDGRFQPYFVEGVTEFPTISNALLFNENNLIVIAFVTNPPPERGNSYLVPKPGVRLNLADLVENLPPGAGVLRFITGINEHGDLVGFGAAGGFLLERVGAAN